MMLAVMPSVVVMLPEPIHTVVTAPEVITAITLVVVGVLTWFAVKLKWSTDRMQETVDSTHEQVANTHSTNLRDDMDGVSGKWTITMLQVMLNRSYAGSGKLLSKRGGYDG